MRLILQSERLRLAVLPRVGGGISDFSMRDSDGRFQAILRPAALEQVRGHHELAAFPMMPWPNRVAGGRFRFDGSDYAMPPDWEDGSAIHGYVKNRQLNVAEHQTHLIRLRFSSIVYNEIVFPAPFECEVEYRLSNSSLAVVMTVRNTGARELMPAGVGFHPYFMRHLWEMDDEVEVRVDFEGRYPLQAKIPTGPAVRDDLVDQLARGAVVDGLDLDDCFVGSLDGAEIRWPESGVVARLSCSEEIGHTVIFTGDPDDYDWFCLEPATMANDGFNLLESGQEGHGVKVLEAGQSLRAEFEITLTTD